MRRTAPAPAMEEQAVFTAPPEGRIAAYASLAAYLRTSIEDIERRMATDRESILAELRERNASAVAGEIEPGSPEHCAACEVNFLDGQRGADALALIERRA